MSSWDYQAFDPANPTTEIPYELRGGLFYVDPVLTEPKGDHRLYAVSAPGIPAASGGSIRFFDGYMGPNEGDAMRALNASAIHLSPDASVEVTKLRVFVYYPAGAAQEHVLRLVTYRPLGMF